jgi:fatty-acyl-CoA synthase
MSTLSHTQLTPLRFLERSAEVFPGKVAIVHGDRRTTYRDFAREATRLARAFVRRGWSRATAWPTCARTSPSC